jgi:Tol biopolymer transport system component
MMAGLVALTLTVSAQVKDRPEVLLQAAIKQQLVEGDLPGAIEQFKKLAQNSSPEVAAQALVHLAECYDKLGQQADARTSYERVVREHPTQKKAVTEARGWLDTHPMNAERQQRISVEQVWAGKDASSAGRPSADGRYLPFVDRSSGYGNLALRDLKTGENRLLTRDAGSTGWAGGQALVSPDGKQIAYRWAGGKNDSLRLIGVDGTNMRILARRPYGDYLEAWSPDGRYLAVHSQSSVDATSQIILLSTADGAIKQMKSTGWRWPTIGGFSPDGRFLVYSLPKDDRATGHGDVFALAVDGSRDIPIVQDRASNTSPVWDPEGRRVVFVSDRSGTAGLWTIRVTDGRAEGSPELLRANVGNVIPLGFTRDGTFFYRTENVWMEAYTADFDADRLTVTNPLPVSDRFVGSNSRPELSPDGKYVAFLRGQAGGAAAGAPPTLMIKSLATGEERALDPRGGYGRLQWFPDSRSLLVQSRGESNRSTFRKIALDSAETQTLFETAQIIWNTAALSPDGKAVFYTVAEIIGDRSGPGDLKSLRLVKRRLSTGEETELYRAESTGFGFFGLSVSSDGSRIAFQLNVAGGKRAVMLMSADGGTPREIYRSNQSSISHLGGMSWMPDGRHLIVTGKCGPGIEDQLCALPSDGGDLRPVGQSMQEISSRMISADGRRVAFTGTTGKQELWVIRNLFPERVRYR